MGQIKTYIFDLDGTLANIDERRVLSSKGNGKLHWGRFLDPVNVMKDKPNKAVIDVFKILSDAGHNMVIFSGRSESTRETTVEWLNDHGIDYNLLVMRPINDYSPDDKLKESWINKYLPNIEIAAVFDDRDKVVAMWRQKGLTCFAVAEGNF